MVLMLNTILLLIAIVLLLRINFKLGKVEPRDYVAEALERDRRNRERETTTRKES